MDWERLHKEIRIQNWIILLAFGLISFFFMSPSFTLGVILGGLIIIANFNIHQDVICGFFLKDGTMKQKKTAIIVKSYFRLAIMGIIIYILIAGDWVNPIGLTIGLSIVVISIVNIGIRSIWKTSSREVI